MLSSGFSAIVAGTDSLLKNKLKLYSGEYPDVQLFFINSADNIDSVSDIRSSDVFILPASVAFENTDCFSPEKIPVICYGDPSLMDICFTAGCADYLCSPWTVCEFYNRIRRVCGVWVLTVGACSLSSRSGCRLTLYDDNAYFIEQLTVDEQSILRLLMKNRGVFFSREALEEYLGKNSGTAQSRKIDMTICRLRNKIDKLAANVPEGERRGIRDIILNKTGSGWGIQ